MPVKKSSIKKSKTKVAMSSTIDLILDGAVYAVKYNSQKKIISKIELDSKIVLKTLVCVLTKTAKKKP